MLLFIYYCFTFSIPDADNDAGGGGKGNCISWARLAAKFANSCIFTYIGCWSWWVANSILYHNIKYHLKINN